MECFHLDSIWIFIYWLRCTILFWRHIINSIIPYSFFRQSYCYFTLLSPSFSFVSFSHFPIISLILWYSSPYCSSISLVLQWPFLLSWFLQLLQAVDSYLKIWSYHLGFFFKIWFLGLKFRFSSLHSKHLPTKLSFQVHVSLLCGQDI